MKTVEKLVLQVPLNMKEAMNKRAVTVESESDFLQNGKMTKHSTYKSLPT